jgi:hypothetical protein
VYYQQFGQKCAAREKIQIPFPKKFDRTHFPAILEQEQTTFKIFEAAATSPLDVGSRN